jgi:isocitrate dehydrogenase (NAD+)
LGECLFINKCREVSKNYPNIIFIEESVDTLCMKITMEPKNYDVIVMPNLYGDIVSDLCAGFIGGVGLSQSANIGKNAAVFEAVHGTAPDIAGQNIANPTALLLSSVMMLKHLNLDEMANKLQESIFTVLKEGKYITCDLGGNTSTTDYTNAIISNLDLI